MHKMLKAFHSLVRAPPYILLSLPLNHAHARTRQSMNHKHIWHFPPADLRLLSIPSRPHSQPTSSVSLPSAHPSCLTSSPFWRLWVYSRTPCCDIHTVDCFLHTWPENHTYYVRGTVHLWCTHSHTSFETEGGSLFFVLFFPLWKPCPGVSEFPGPR